MLHSRLPLPFRNDTSQLKPRPKSSLLFHEDVSFVGAVIFVRRGAQFTVRCGCGSGMTPWIDGLLEGHETRSFVLIYRLWMITYIIFGLFAGLCNVGLIMHDGSNPAFAMVSLMVIGFLVYSLYTVKTFKEDGLDPKFKRASGVLMLFVTVLSIASVMIFNSTLNYKKEECAPEPAPLPPWETTTLPPETTFPPNGTTPAPSGNGTNTTPPAGFEQWRIHQMYLERMAADAQQRAKAVQQQQQHQAKKKAPREHGKGRHSFVSDGKGATP